MFGLSTDEMEKLWIKQKKRIPVNSKYNFFSGSFLKETMSHDQNVCNSFITSDKGGMIMKIIKM
jgi:hypothetical protein